MPDFDCQNVTVTRTMMIERVACPNIGSDALTALH